MLRPEPFKIVLHFVIGAASWGFLGIIGVYLLLSLREAWKWLKRN